jgi:hypothetical protein
MHTQQRELLWFYDSKGHIFFLLFNILSPKILLEKKTYLIAHKSALKIHRERKKKINCFMTC